MIEEGLWITAGQLEHGIESDWINALRLCKELYDDLC